MTLTQFQRDFRRAREAADRGELIVISGEPGDYVFERRRPVSGNPFAGLAGVFGAVSLPPSSLSSRDQIRRRLAQKFGRR